MCWEKRYPRLQYSQKLTMWLTWPLAKSFLQISAPLQAMKVLHISLQHTLQQKKCHIPWWTQQRWANAQPTGIGTLCTKRPSAFWLKAPSLLKISTSWAKIQTCHKYTLCRSHILPFERNPTKKLVSIYRQLVRVSTTVSGLSTVSINFGRAVKETDKVEMFDWTHTLPIFILMIYNGTYEFGSFYNLGYPVFSG